MSERVKLRLWKPLPLSLFPLLEGRVVKCEIHRASLRKLNEWARVARQGGREGSGACLFFFLLVRDVEVDSKLKEALPFFLHSSTQQSRACLHLHGGA